VAEKPRDAAVNFDRPTYRNLQQHRAVFPAIARHLVTLLKTIKSRHHLSQTGPVSAMTFQITEPERIRRHFQYWVTQCTLWAYGINY